VRRRCACRGLRRAPGAAGEDCGAGLLASVHGRSGPRRRRRRRPRPLDARSRARAGRAGGGRRSLGLRSKVWRSLRGGWGARGRRRRRRRCARKPNLPVEATDITRPYHSSKAPTRDPAALRRPFPAPRAPPPRAPRPRPRARPVPAPRRLNAAPTDPSAMAARPGAIQGRARRLTDACEGKAHAHAAAEGHGILAAPPTTSDGELNPGHDRRRGRPRPPWRRGPRNSSASRPRPQTR
jgi:hypothetical protein